MGESTVMSKTREAWSEFSSEFADIAEKFKANYATVAETAETGSEASRKSIERSVKAIRGAMGSMADALGNALRDPAVKDETEEAGSALLRAFGVTVSEIGEKLQRLADNDGDDSSS
jgi:hypothetical protein